MAVSFNIFRTTADLMHVIAIVILLYRIRVLKNCAGVSLKTQELYLLVFLTRYVDIFWNFISIYNTIMKIIFIGTTAATVYLMRFRYNHTYDKEHDTFRVLFLIMYVLGRQSESVRESERKLAPAPPR
jgi:ER lumen protein retaining receptor